MTFHLPIIDCLDDRADRIRHSRKGVPTERRIRVDTTVAETDTTRQTAPCLATGLGR
jgi:hypothetical protein